jgi:hypothetical protein
MSDDEIGATMASFSAGVRGVGRASLSVGVDGSSKKKRRKVNPWHLGLDCVITFVCVFFLSTAATLSRALAFGNDWIGMCAIAGVTTATFLFHSICTGGSVLPHFDIITILLSLRQFGIASYRKKNVKHVPSETSQYVEAVDAITITKNQYSYDMGMTTAIALIIAVMAGAFASAGICRLVLDSAYDNAEIVIRDSDFNAGEAFFVELFGYVFLNFLVLQLPLNGVHPAITAIVLGFSVLGFQALGFNISSASYSFTRWLSVNAVGGHSAWSNDSWVWPVAGVVAVVTIFVLNFVMSALRYYGDNYKSYAVMNK